MWHLVKLFVSTYHGWQGMPSVAMADFFSSLLQNYYQMSVTD